jgi:hypothetical protein
VADQTTDLLGPQSHTLQRPRNFLCRDADISPVASGISKYNGKWWEWQANRAIGGLLLPRPLVEKLVERYTKHTQVGPMLKETLRPAAEKEVVRTFDVNPVVARIRLKEMFPVEKSRSF